MQELAGGKHPRWNVYGAVVPHTRRKCDWSATNISQGGMFVSGKPILRTGAQMDVELVLPGAFGPSLEIACRVHVVWNRLPTEAQPGRPAGMGMRFIRMPAHAHRELQTYIGELAAHQSAPQPGGRWSGKQADEIVLQDEVQSRDTEVVQVSDRDLVRTGEQRPEPTSLPCPLPAGTNLGAYRIIEQLGEGGMGEVYLAEHRILGRRVALKRLHSRFLHDRASVRRFFDEGRLINQVESDHIVEITDFVASPQIIYYVMEFLRGRTLTDLGRAEGPLSPRRTSRIAAQVCDALATVHDAGIIHRDLKPDNIILAERGGSPDFVKLLDFGIAKLRQTDPNVAQDGLRTMAGVVVGTPGYMAPEQLLGDPVDQRVDIYALGVLLYQMLTGEMPFAAKTWPELIVKQTTRMPESPSRRLGHRLPGGLDHLVLNCLQLKPDRRPASTRAVAESLRFMHRSH